MKPLLATSLAFIVLSTAAPAQAATNDVSDADVVARIRDEGWQHSEVMQTLSYLADVIGPRLTGSPNLKRANEWTRDKLERWGLTNAHLEAWGPFGRGWTLKRFSAAIVEPQPFPLIACPNAWSAGLDQPLVANVVLFDARTNADLEKFKGKLEGAIVLASPKRELAPAFEPFAVRQSDSNLLWYANAGEPATAGTGTNRSAGRSFRRRETASASTNAAAADRRGTNSNPGLVTGIVGRPVQRLRSQPRYLSFLAKEGAAAIVYASTLGEGGTVFVAGASVPGSDPSAPVAGTNTPRAWATNAPPITPQITLAVEDYNRLVRMIEQGQKLKMSIDLQAQYETEDLKAYNTVAELPGSDLKNEIIMLGAHLDSWHAGTGATDNGAGVAATMEAMRILTALHLHPRRTIRIGLWSGEEQGLMGSRAYVAAHFGYYTNSSDKIRAPKERAAEPRVSANSTSGRRLVRQEEYDRLSAYFNLDNGAGRIRGVYLQGNEAVRPLFRRWLEPFRDWSAETLTLANTSGTDHLSFDGVGLPGFQFIQDPLDYWTRTHHSNEDVFDRVLPDDLKQAAIILATFAYQAANLDEKLPRKPLDIGL